MLSIIVVAALVLAVVCFGLVMWSAALEWQLRRYGKTEPREPREPRAAIAAAVVFLALAGGAAAIDEKVADPAPLSAGVADAADAASPAAPDAGDDYFASNLAAFSGPASLRSVRITKELCLVRYYARETRRERGDPGANWWTTCSFNEELESVVETRERLALPHAWGARDARVIARIPAGEQVTYLRGRAARQCEPSGGECYAGGGVQLLFDADAFDREWFVLYECSRGAEREVAAFEPCAG